MQTYLLPKGLRTKLDAMIRDFWWGYDQDKQRHLYLKSWNALCALKEAGGLGFRRMRDINEAFITKLVWQLHTREDCLWVNILKAKYAKGLNLMDNAERKGACSWIWQSILNCKNLLFKEICFAVGANSRSRVSEDP